MTYRALIVGAVSGFAGALVSDLHAYSAAPDGQSFNWGKAAARWIAGGLSGAATAAGITLLS